MTTKITINPTIGEWDVHCPYTNINGLTNGEKSYYDGDMHMTVNYENGLIHGKCSGYNDETEETIESNYMFDRLHGKYIEQNKDTIFSEGEYYHGKKHGKWTYRHPNGGIRGEVFYIYGMRHGKEIAFREDGSKILEYNYENGYEHGKQLDYYDNKTNSVNLERIVCGKEKYNYYKSYHKNGNVKCEGRYKGRIDPDISEKQLHKAKIGLWKQYDVNGNIIHMRIHDNHWVSSTWVSPIERHKNKTIVECYKNGDFKTVEDLLLIANQRGCGRLGWYEDQPCSEYEIDRLIEKCEPRAK